MHLYIFRALAPASGRRGETRGSLPNWRKRLSSCCLPLTIILPHSPAVRPDTHPPPPPVSTTGDHCSVAREGQTRLQMKGEQSGEQGSERTSQMNAIGIPKGLRSDHSFEVLLPGWCSSSIFCRWMFSLCFSFICICCC